jgi:tRNA1(Val) A37 N6-methylase TrmN6
LNKKLICFLGIERKDRKNLLVSLVEAYEHTHLSVSAGVLSLAVRVLKCANLLSENWEKSPASRIEELLKQWLLNHINDREEILQTFSAFHIQNENDDILGAFYQSIQSISQKSSSGSYYTPGELLEGIKVPLNKTVLDPCCGSGGILLKILTKNHKSEHIFARDIDEIAVNICNVNMALFFDDPNYKSKIELKNILEREESGLFDNPKSSETFDYIITNPPWGGKLSKQQKDYLLHHYPEINTTETFGISLFNCLNMLTFNGVLYFFMPHSFLNVATHRHIRKMIMSRTGSISIKLLGNAFKGVLSEAILLKYSNNLEKNEITVIQKNNEVGTIQKNNIANNGFIISATSREADNTIIDKIYSKAGVFLKGNAIFALGVVTGNNDKHILKTPGDKAEPIFRGKDIQKFRYVQPECFIEFKPEKYQQVAPVEYYRQKKIVYRFISDKIVCAVDYNNHLLLNSANLFIPLIDYPFEAIVCLFNSSVYSFIYQKKFHSKKVLRSHIEEFPLPKINGMVKTEFSKYHTDILNGIDRTDEIENLTASIFGISETELKHIQGCINGNAK